MSVCCAGPANKLSALKYIEYSGFRSFIGFGMTAFLVEEKENH
jgi:hypothetical protein